MVVSGRYWLSWLLVVVVVVVVGVTTVEGVHPKHKNLLGGSSTQFGVSLEGSEGGSVYRMRRQQPRRQQIHISSIEGIRRTLQESNRRLGQLDSKLMRHEYRESQAADFSAKTLNLLNAEVTHTKDSISNIARQLAAVEEKLISVITLVANSDEQQKTIMNKMVESLDRLLVASAEPHFGSSPNAMPELPPGMALQTTEDLQREVQGIIRQMELMKGNTDTRIQDVSLQVRELKDTMEQQLGAARSGQEQLVQAVMSCTEASSATNTIGSESCQRLESEISQRMEKMMGEQENQGKLLWDIKEGAAVALGQQEAGLQGLLSEMRHEAANSNGSFSLMLEGLQELQQISQQNLGALHSNLKDVLDQSNVMIQQRIDGMESRVKADQTSIMEALDETSSMADNLQSAVQENYEYLSQEISGLNKIEQVMMNTADAVLDTKRSIEFGIQQIILELGEIVSQSGKNINSTLSYQISAISFDILKNQTSALTNMTQRMESEISQVWRQIGIMYQQVEQSINMLDNLQDTTNHHMNVSLNRVGNMDGTVGEINGKVADVEENLNYLLGRLSLVLSEFNHMKSGVGDELNRLREMAQEVTISNGDTENPEYKIIKNRHIYDDSH